jgi:mannosyl-oligosaccharide alpha-1,2-mannosidase
MMRLRKDRAFIIVAIILVFGLYQFATVRDWDSVGTTGVEHLKEWTGPLTSPSTEKSSPADKPKKPESTEDKPDKPDADKDRSKADTKPAQAEAVDEDEEELKATSTGEPIPTDKPDIEVGRFGEFSVGGKGRHEAPLPLNDKPLIHWTRMPEHFPVPTDQIIPLPTGKPKKIPTIQYKFGKETDGEKKHRFNKLLQIRAAMNHSWTGYKEHAWMHDELSPVSGGHRDPFCAWAATLVDSLDTLWIMDMKDEFLEAVDAVGELNFTTSRRKDIPVFETTIRYLGGLLAAYDVSGKKYNVLKDKAVELAEVLMGAFDTPNRMPVMYYYWRPTFAKNPHRSAPRVVMAEIGSLSVDLTRLAQVTGDDKYYDAIARITNEFEAWQNSTKIPGLWPKVVDASGCRKPEVSDPLWFSHNQESQGVQPDTDEPSLDPTLALNSTSQTGAVSQEVHAPKEETPKPETPKEEDSKQIAEVDTKPSGKTQGTTEVNEQHHKRQIDVAPKETDADSKPLLTSSTSTTSAEKVDCEPQGLNSPPGATWETFSLGGQADSTFEYLPKQHMLLGGLVDQYQSMYEQVADASVKHLLFKPMIPQEDRHILVAGSVEATANRGVSKSKRISLRPDHTHLTCFVGGMFGIGAKIFDRKEDLDIAARLTDGCVWAYEATASGIMPEDMQLMPCEDKDAPCPWNQTRWFDTLDPFREGREAGYEQSKKLEAERLAGEANKADEDKKSDEIKKVEKAEEAKKAEAAKLVAEAKKAEESNSAEQDHKDEDHKASGADEAKKAEAAKLVEEAKKAEEDQKTEENKKVVGADEAKKAEAAKLVEEANKAAEAKQPEPAKPAEAKEHALGKRQLGAIENDADTAIKTQPKPLDLPTSTLETGTKFPTHEEYVQQRIKAEHIPLGIPSISSKSYLLRPEAIESVFIMYRITGDETWREKGWKMWEAIEKHTKTEHGYSAIGDVTSEDTYQLDEMESFWTAETLKYFYLLFSTPDTISLDDYVLWVPPSSDEHDEANM